MDKRIREILYFFSNLGDPKIKRKIYVFSACILISAFIWVMIKLSKEYTTEIKYPIVYQEVPHDKVLVKASDSILSLKIETKGFRLFFLRNIRIPHPLYINVSESLYKIQGSKNRYFLPISEFGRDLNRQLNSKTTLLSIEPDTLFVRIKDVESKKVPVKAQYSIELPNQYKPYGPINVKPDSIIVSGLDNYLDTLEFVSTKPFVVKKIEKEQYDIPVANAYKKHGLHLSKDKFTVHIDIEKYTEEQRILPLYVFNEPDTIEVKTFPSEVEVSYLLAIKDYNKIANSDFKAFVDYNDITNDKNTLRVKLDEYPDQVDINNISPKRVEFIIIRND